MKIRGAWTTGAGEQVEVTTRPVDVIAWERATGSKIGSGGGMGMDDMCRMLWNAARRERITDADYDDWLAAIDDLDVAAVTPTRPGAAPSGG